MMITNFTSIAHLKELDYHSLYLFSWFKHGSRFFARYGRSWGGEKKKKKKSRPFTRMVSSLFTIRCPYKLRFVEPQHVLVEHVCICWLYVQGQGHGATIYRLLVRDADRTCNKSTRGCTLLGSPWVLQPLTFPRIYARSCTPLLCRLMLLLLAQRRYYEIVSFARIKSSEERIQVHV